jgi:hypothetical protein
MVARVTTTHVVHARAQVHVQVGNVNTDAVLYHHQHDTSVKKSKLKKQNKN